MHLPLKQNIMCLRHRCAIKISLISKQWLEMCLRPVCPCWSWQSFSVLLLWRPLVGAQEHSPRASKERFTSQHFINVEIHMCNEHVFCCCHYTIWCDLFFLTTISACCSSMSSFSPRKECKLCMWPLSRHVWQIERILYHEHLLYRPDPVSYYNPLHIAVLRNRPNMVRLLVSHGADIERRDRVRELSPVCFCRVIGSVQLWYVCSSPARSMRAVLWIWPVKSQRDSHACSPCWIWVLM